MDVKRTQTYEVQLPGFTLSITYEDGRPARAEFQADGHAAMELPLVVLERLGAAARVVREQHSREGGWLYVCAVHGYHETHICAGCATEKAALAQVEVIPANVHALHP